MYKIGQCVCPQMICLAFTVPPRVATASGAAFEISPCHPSKWKLAMGDNQYDHYGSNQYDHASGAAFEISPCHPSKWKLAMGDNQYDHYGSNQYDHYGSSRQAYHTDSKLIISYLFYHTYHIILIISYLSYHTYHIILIISYLSYHTYHIILIISYLSYHTYHIIDSKFQRNFHKWKLNSFSIESDYRTLTGYRSQTFRFNLTSKTEAFYQTAVLNIFSLITIFKQI